MALTKTKLKRMIEKRKEGITIFQDRLSLTKNVFIEQNKKFLQDKTEAYITKYYETSLCGISTGIYRREIEIELLTNILNKFYQPKQRKPSKFEQAKERLQQLEKQYNEGSIRIKMDLQWEIDSLRSFISGIEQMEKAKKALEEEQEIVE